MRKKMINKVMARKSLIKVSLLNKGMEVPYLVVAL
jgi:hypothetical protein